MERKKFIYYIKFFAVLFVLNSHLDSVYPVAFLATGGAIGNCLFFMNSGYTWSNLKETSFFKWFIRKIKNLWIPTIFTNIVFLILYFNDDMTVVNLFKVFIYPNKSWFCGAMMLYSIGYYFFVKNNNKWKNRIYFITGIIVYFIYYILFLDKSSFNIEIFKIDNISRIIFYFLCMCFGFYYKKHEQSFSQNKYKCLTLSIIFFIGIYGLKYLMSNYSIVLNFQFLNQAMTLFCVFYFYRFLQLSENNLKSSRIVRWIANYSWEIYLTQTLLIPLFAELVFPLNLVVILCAIIVSSIVLRYIVKFTYAIIDKIFGKKEKIQNL